MFIKNFLWIYQIIITKTTKTTKPKIKLFPKNWNNIYRDTAKLKGTLNIWGTEVNKKFKVSASTWMKFNISPSEIWFLIKIEVFINLS